MYVNYNTRKNPYSSNFGELAMRMLGVFTDAAPLSRFLKNPRNSMPMSRVAQSYFPRRFIGLRPLALIAAVSLLLAGCGKSGNAQGGGSPPPTEVGVVTVTQGDVALITELPGRLEASRIAQVRARLRAHEVCRTMTALTRTAASRMATMASARQTFALIFR